MQTGDETYIEVCDAGGVAACATSPSASILGDGFLAVLAQQYHRARLRSRSMLRDEAERLGTRRP